MRILMIVETKLFILCGFRRVAYRHNIFIGLFIKTTVANNFPVLVSACRTCLDCRVVFAMFFMANGRTFVF